MKTSILIPCYNEELTIERCVLSCLSQSQPADQIVVVDDCSTDKSAEILKKYAKQVTVVRTPKNTRNKSSAQEYGMGFITGDIVIMTDGDTIMHEDFVKEIVLGFDSPQVGAVSGMVRSMKYNWLTRCRAFEYVISNHIHKLSQSYLGVMMVIPGAAGAFRTDIFRKYLTFDHDTLTEDLDFTYKLHKHGFHINYTRKALVLTQDPATLHSYINQMRRWFGGGWQNLLKHRGTVIERPQHAMELSLLYIEGLIFSVLLFLTPLISIHITFIFLIPSLLLTFAFAAYAAYKDKRADLLLAPIPYLFLSYVNAYIFIEQFVKVVILRKNTLIWFKPQRVEI